MVELKISELYLTIGTLTAIFLHLHKTL